MDNQLIIVSNNHSLYKALEDEILTMDFNCKEVLPSNFMVEVFKRKPDFVLVDLESVSYQDITSIETVLEEDYIQTLYIYEHFNPKWPLIINNGSLMPLSRCRLVMKDLIIHACISNKHLNRLASNYETMKLMEEEFDRVLNAYMKALKENEPKVIDDFLSLVYSNNMMTKQTPRWFVVIHQGFKGVQAHIFGSGQEDIEFFYQDKMSITAYLEKASEAGLYVNFNLKTLSDISTIEEVMPLPLIAFFEESFLGFDKNTLKNMTTFAVDNVLFLGLDYSQPLSSYDLSIFKGVCDKINKLYMVKSNIVDLQESFIYTMDALARAAESKDDITGHHIKRVNDYSALIAREIGMDDGFINDIQISAQMHDVGKISISESILNKPGKLTEDEFVEMKKHTVYGAAIVGDSTNLQMAKIIAQSHHEKYDGSGYPEGLKGQEIPIEARIVSLADIYDALRSQRSYKEGFSHERAYDIITKGDGRVMPDHFDPQVLEAFKRVHEVMKNIYDATID